MPTIDADWLGILKGQPLFAVGITLVAYAIADDLWDSAGRSAFLNPVLVASALMAVLLVWIDCPYNEYLLGAQPINETLSAIVVLLAVPLARQFHLIRSSKGPLLVALVFGSAVAFVSALLTPVLAGADDAVLATLVPKSSTAAVAVQVSERLGGMAGLTAVIVISTGIFGAAFGPAILHGVGIQDDRAKGFALGVASHAIGTARAFQISDTAGAFASLGMILHAILIIATAPLVMAALTD
jgi:predicted murein hydrolase (TIGR00659 family)